MPAQLLREEVFRIRGKAPELFDTQVSDLATKFGVSEQAMTIRLSSLRLL
jgi:hypothetical protein